MSSIIKFPKNRKSNSLRVIEYEFFNVLVISCNTLKVRWSNIFVDIYSFGFQTVTSLCKADVTIIQDGAGKTGLPSPRPTWA